ncbi:hypothetical protein MUB24_12660 [Lederbergia sp. NSJ-179]|uniref:hypothetical protein n=1 Tax=Lederbergia sp. NSJ-179 TaxID=2931402 RepID=UPI001FD2E88F|nr:hypothetical protein [Lederbergia sp. NSJ-179]MCJ7841733.1 hypothetical protein [Lederbergia sp. NSJ-179]
MDIFKQIRGEYLKLKRLPDLILILSLFFAFLILMFFQKGINGSSGFYTPELLSVQYLISFNLLLLSLVGFIPSAVIGAYISGVDYKNNTNVYMITNYGRIQSIMIKLIALCTFLLIFVSFVVFLSAVEALAINGQNSLLFKWKMIIPQFFSSYMILLVTASIGFMGATLMKKVYGGIVIAIILPLLLEQLTTIVSILNNITLSQWTSSLIAHSFQNIENDPQVQFSQVTTQSFTSIVFTIFAFLLIMYFLTLLITIKRDFKS